jgi:hypothetical protein
MATAAGSTVFRAIVLETGDFWAGPQECRLTVANGQLMGFQLVGRNMLLAYFGHKLPPSQATAVAVEDQLARVENEVATGTFKEDAAIVITSLLSGEPRLSGATEFILRDCDFQDAALVVQVQITEPQLLLRIKTGPDLKILGSEISSTVTPRKFE